MKYDVYMAEWYSNSINVKQHQTSRSTIYISTVHIYMHHIISCCIHYECKHEKQVFPCTTWTLKSLYNAGHKLKHFWSQIVPGHKLKHFVVTNRAAVTNWSESQIVPSHGPLDYSNTWFIIAIICIYFSHAWYIWPILYVSLFKYDIYVYSLTKYIYIYKCMYVCIRRAALLWHSIKHS